MNIGVSDNKYQPLTSLLRLPNPQAHGSLKQKITYFLCAAIYLFHFGSAASWVICCIIDHKREGRGEPCAARSFGATLEWWLQGNSFWAALWVSWLLYKELSYFPSGFQSWKEKIEFMNKIFLEESCGQRSFGFILLLPLFILAVKQAISQLSKSNTLSIVLSTYHCYRERMSLRHEHDHC